LGPRHFASINSKERIQGEIPHEWEDDYQLALEVLCLKKHQSWNYNSPFASFGVEIRGVPFRATLVHHSLTGGGTSRLFLRRLRPQQFKIQDFSKSDEITSCLEKSVSGKCNLLISGSTGSGKTSLLGALLSLIPSQEHVVILEDSAELGCARPTHTHLLSEEATQGKTLKDYCAYALRMRPDRMALGEIRSAEVVPFLLAMNTGHQGLLASVHANSPVDALGRIALLFCLYSGQENITYTQVLRLVTDNIGMVVHMENKKVVSIIRVLGCDEGRPMYEWVFKN
jgi:type IV secretion system protein VirB11